MHSNHMTTTTTNQAIATRAHKFAADYAARWGIPANVLEQAASAADLLGLEGFARTLFVERAAGHWMNLEATGKGA